MEIRCSSCSTRNRVPVKRLEHKARCAKCKAPLLPVAIPIAVATATEFDELIREAPNPVLVDFWAAWCNPCKLVAPELEKVARDQVGKVIVAKLDTEAVPAIADRFGIRSIPTMILFRGGDEARRLTGAMSALAITQQLGL